MKPLYFVYQNLQICFDVGSHFSGLTQSVLIISEATWHPLESKDCAMSVSTAASFTTYSLFMSKQCSRKAVIINNMIQRTHVKLGSRLPVLPQCFWESSSDLFLPATRIPSQESDVVFWN